MFDTIGSIIESVDSKMAPPKLLLREDATTGVATLLFGRARAKLLALLFTQPEREYYFREIARLSGLSTSTLHRELPPG